MSWPKDADGNSLRELHVKSRLDAAEGDLLTKASKTYEMSGVELAHVQNDTGVNTTVPIYSAAAAVVPGCLLDLPANDERVWLEWGTQAYATFGGSGLIELSIWDVTAGGAGTLLTAAYRGLTSAQPLYSGYTNTLPHRFRLGASATDRKFQLKVLLFRDSGSGLVAGLWNTPTFPTFVSAVQR